MKETNSCSIKVLLIEDNPGDARLIQEAFADAHNSSFDLLWVDLLDKGIDLAAKHFFDVILLDLSLPDSQGISSIITIREKAPIVPIVVLTGLNDEKTAISAMQHGAQDYLIKGQVNSAIIVRSIRYAIERHRLQGELYKLSMIDDLTGLYNRRGFFTLMEQNAYSGDSEDSGSNGFFLIVSDLDGMKQINDSYGHHYGDLALVDTSNILKEIFHDSLIIARMGGDEFIVIAPQDPTNLLSNEMQEKEILSRMQEKLNYFNQTAGRCFHLSISLGLASFHPNSMESLDELIIQADHRMYTHKKDKLKYLK